MKEKIKIIVAMLIWGSMGLFVRYINLSSSQIAFFRGIIGVFFLLGVSAFMKIKISKKALINNRLLLITSGIALGVNWIFLFESYKYTTIAIATLTYYLAPIIITVLSPLILREKLTNIKIICLIIALTGLAFVSGVFSTSLSDTNNGLGILYGISAAIAYASLTLMNKFIQDMTSMEATIVQLGVASIVLLPYVLLTSSTDIVIKAQAVILLIILGVIHTGLAFWLFFSSIQNLKAQVIAVFSYIDPVTAIVLSALILKEKLSLIQIIGAFFILGSTLINERFGNFNQDNR